MQSGKFFCFFLNQALDDRGRWRRLIYGEGVGGCFQWRFVIFSASETDSHSNSPGQVDSLVLLTVR